MNGRPKLFAQHDLDTQPYGADQAGDDYGDNGFEGVTLGLLDALAPASEMLKIRPQPRADVAFMPRRVPSRSRAPANAKHHPEKHALGHRPDGWAPVFRNR